MPRANRKVIEEMNRRGVIPLREKKR